MSLGDMIKCNALNIFTLLLLLLLLFRCCFVFVFVFVSFSSLCFFLALSIMTFN